ncbi:MAG: diacylglycerol kinase family protein [Oscillospiraceae bacterium]|nr:diacylglycerol kinase family protein [Oscillospiraceae bacterium]
MAKSHSLSESFRHAIDGFADAVKSERNMKIHCAATVIITVFAFTLGLSIGEKAVLLILCGLVIAAELFNTALENTVDLASPELHPLAKRAKDSAAAAVFIMSITAAVVGIIIFWPYGMEILDNIQHLI